MVSNASDSTIIVTAVHDPWLGGKGVRLTPVREEANQEVLFTKRRATLHALSSRGGPKT